MYNHDTGRTPVTVLGLGMMGQALAGAFLRDGYPTTVWNRTAAKAEHLVAQGAKLAGSVGEAVTDGALVVVCVSDYDAVRELLEPAGEALDGRVLVNLTSGTSRAARAMAEWAARRGGLYLDGAILAVPSAIGADAVILYSGPRPAFDRYEPALRTLGAGTTHLGDDHGLSALYDVAGLSVMWGVLNAWLQGVALLSTAGVDASAFTPFAAQVAQETVGWLPGYAAQIDRGSFTPDDATLATHAGGIAHLVRVSEKLGVDAELPRLFGSVVARAIAAGRAELSYAALIEQLTPAPGAS